MKRKSDYLPENKDTTLKDGILKKVSIAMTKKRGVRLEEMYSGAIREVNKKAR